jgi:hypothetical protein
MSASHLLGLQGPQQTPAKKTKKNVLIWSQKSCFQGMWSIGFTYLPLSPGPLLICIYFWEILQEKWPENSYKITRWSQGLRLQCLLQTVFSCFQFKSPQVNSQKRETVSLSTLRSTLQSNCHFKSASQKAQQRLKCMPSTAVWFIRKSVVVFTIGLWTATGFWNWYTHLALLFYKDHSKFLVSMVLNFGKDCIIFGPFKTILRSFLSYQQAHSVAIFEFLPCFGHFTKSL